MAPETPAAVVRWAGTPQQSTVVAGLADLPAAAESLESPAVVLVGPTVPLRRQIAWFERCPLFGQRVLITRPDDRSCEFADLLRELGAQPIVCPSIRIAPPEDPGPLRRAAAKASAYDWVVFNSANAVDAFWQALRSAGLDARALAGCRLAAIGPATSARLSTQGLGTNLIPEDYTSQALVEALKAADDLRGRRVLCPRSDLAPEALLCELNAAGAEVEEVVAYRTLPDADGLARAAKLIARREVDWVTFTSASTVRCLLEAAGSGAVRSCGARLVSIGPATTQALRDVGLEPDAEAVEHTIRGLVAAILAHAEAGAKQ
jgi:uroporphyrinogen III methyltransferase/synthase